VQASLFASLQLFMTTIPVPWLETSRLALREFTPVDFDDLYRLDSDPRVMRYLNNGQPLSHAEVREALARILKYYPHYHGLGVWRAARRDSGEFIGWFCLKYCPPTCDVEVGYRLLPQVWGRGFATEGASALVTHALRNLGLFQVIGVTHPGNKASQRVLLKSGFDDAGWGFYYGKRVRVFAAKRARTQEERRSSMPDALPDLRAFPALLDPHHARWSERKRV
jgi:RimJ/RimL family protein N-acetyltransferase